MFLSPFMHVCARMNPTYIAILITCACLIDFIQKTWDSEINIGLLHKRLFCINDENIRNLIMNSIIESKNNNQWNVLLHSEDESNDKTCYFSEYAIYILVQSLTSQYTQPKVYNKCINKNKYLNKDNINWRYTHCVFAITALINSTESIVCINKCIESLINNNNYRIKYVCIITMNIIKNACLIDCMSYFDKAVGGNKFKQNAIESINGTILLFFNIYNINDINADPLIKANITLWTRILPSIGTEEFYKYLQKLSEILTDIININIIHNDNNEYDDYNYIVSTAAKQIVDKLAVLYIVHFFLNKCNNIMILLISQLFNSLSKCIKCKYSLQTLTKTIKLSM